MFQYSLMLLCLDLATIYNLNYSVLLISTFGNLYKLFTHFLYNFNSRILTILKSTVLLHNGIKHFPALYETSALLQGSIDLHPVHILSTLSLQILFNLLSLQPHLCMYFDCAFCIYLFLPICFMPIFPFLFYFANIWWKYKI
jgi:hypothetical protein